MTITVEDTKRKVDLETVIENLPVAIIVFDGERRILLANKTAVTYAGKTKQEFFGLHGGEAFGCVNSDLVPEGCGFSPVCEFCKVRNTVLDTLKDQNERSGVETAVTFLDKGQRYLRISTTYLELRSGGCVILAMEDITEIKGQEMLRLENEKLLAAVETGGAVCHEMNQPMQVVSLISELLMSDNENKESVYKNLKTIKDQIDRMGEITRKLMRITSYKTKGYLNRSILDIDEASAEGASNRNE